MKKLTCEEFIRKANAVHKNRYDYSLVEYSNTCSLIKIKCPVHDVFEQIPHNHLQGQGCSSCSHNKKLNTDSFVERARYIHQNRYDYSQLKYKNMYSMIKIGCPIHGEFRQRANNHINGQGCPICKESKGEKLIRNWLTKNKITFNGQYTIFGCKNEKNLLFDFAIFDNNNLIGLIEYNNEDQQNHKTTRKLLNQQNRDQIKLDYCTAHKIPLLRVSYKEISMINTFLWDFVLNKQKNE